MAEKIKKMSLRHYYTWVVDVEGKRKRDFLLRNKHFKWLKPTPPKKTNKFHF